MGYETYGCIRRTPISAEQIKKKKKKTNIKHDEINMLNIVNDNTFNLYNSLLNNNITQLAGVVEYNDYFSAEE